MEPDLPADVAPDVPPDVPADVDLDVPPDVAADADVADTPADAPDVPPDLPDVGAEAQVPTNALPVVPGATITTVLDGECATLSCDATGPPTDADLDLVTLRWSWTVNGQDTGVETQQLTGFTVAPDATVICAITPNDTHADGATVESPAVVAAPTVSDTDGDAVCDAADVCLGLDADGDTDLDGTCDDLDPCVADPNDDSDANEVCDDLQLCAAIAAATISPADPSPGDALTAATVGVPGAALLSGATVSYAWQVGGTPSGHTAGTLPAGVTSADETWTVTVAASFPWTTPCVGEASVAVVNHAPSCDGAVLGPEGATTTDSLVCSCVGYNDPDSDAAAAPTCVITTASGAELATGPCSVDGGGRRSTRRCALQPDAERWQPGRCASRERWARDPELGARRAGAPAHRRRRR